MIGRSRFVAKKPSLRHLRNGKKTTARAVKWTVVRPRQMQSSKPFLTLLKDNSVLAGGDTAKSVTYDLSFAPPFRDITAVRIEAFPDQACRTAGRAWCITKGSGDFFLSEISLKADGKTDNFNAASQEFGTPAKAAIDGDQQTGWSVAGGTGKPHVAVFGLAQPTGEASDLTLHLLFERYFAAHWATSGSPSRMIRVQRNRPLSGRH